MFRPMRLKKQALSEAETLEILRCSTSGVLSVSGDDGYPYGVPVSYALHEGKLYFHCAKEGHKLDDIRRNEKVSFTVIKADEVIQETFTTHYKSVIAFGKARLLESDEEKRFGLECLVKKYSPDFIPQGKIEIEKSLKRTCVVEIVIEHVSGKAASELFE